ncbi:5554_t:CDS:2 [Acaulospora colombiana]|uniref:5554_t:CDS:1 n=1 Tax=Acaulospora colombiana TaxID=27376 RepID=A0ACA9M6S1_9GLOM|nr:5554_t:CDS:2 [Acaulospora colombiana]
MATLTEIAPPVVTHEREVQLGITSQVEQQLQLKLSDLRTAQAEVQQRFLTIIASFQTFNPILSKLKDEERLSHTQAQKISTLEAEVREKRQKITELEQRDQRKTSEMRSLADHLLTVTQKYQTEQSNLGTLKTVCSDWQSMYSRLQKEIGEVEDRLNRQKRETTDVQTRYEVRLANQRETSNDKIGGLKKELVDLRHDIKRERDKKVDLEITIEKLNVGIKKREEDSERELQELHSRLRDAERARDDAKREIYKLKDRLDADNAKFHAKAGLCERMTSEREDTRTQLKALEAFIREEFPTTGTNFSNSGEDQSHPEADRIAKIGKCLEEIFQDLKSSQDQTLTRHRLMMKRIRSQLKESEDSCSKGKRRQRTLRRQVVAYASRCQELQKAADEACCVSRSEIEMAERRVSELERHEERRENEVKSLEQKAFEALTELEERTNGAIDEAHLSVLRLQLRTSAKLYSIKRRHESEIENKDQQIAALHTIVDAQTQCLDKFAGASTEAKGAAESPTTRIEREKVTSLTIRLPNPNSFRARQEGNMSNESSPTKSGGAPSISTSATFSASALANANQPGSVIELNQLTSTAASHGAALTEAPYFGSTRPSNYSDQARKSTHEKGVSTVENDLVAGTQAIPLVSQVPTTTGTASNLAEYETSKNSVGSHEARLKAVEDRLRAAERRLRDAVIENLELKDKMEVVDGLEESLRSTKKQLKNTEEKLRAAIDENSDLRKRMYR